MLRIIERKIDATGEGEKHRKELFYQWIIKHLMEDDGYESAEEDEEELP